jgi:phage head maturation protease
MSEPFYAQVPRTLRLSVDDSAGDAAPITVTALALPWGSIVDLNVLGDTVEFAAGSVVTADPARVPFLADHDNHPFGYGVSFTDDGAGLVATMAVPRDELSDPRTASVVRQMRNGVRTAVSVGVALDDITATDKGDHTHYLVNRGRLLELSSVVVPRFDDARVQSIAATNLRSTVMPDPNPVPEPDDPPEPDETLEASVLRHPTAAAVVPYRGRGDGAGRPLSLAHLAAAIARPAERGNAIEANRVLRELTAAWTDVTTTDVAGLVHPQWLSEVVGLIEFGAPVQAAFRQGTITSSPINYPYWTTPPSVGPQSPEKTGIVSTAVSITTKSIPVATFAGGNDVSRQTIDWSTPDFVAEYFRAATEMWARLTDQAFVGTLTSKAGHTIAAATHSLVDIIGAAIGVAASAGVSGTINFVCSGDVYGGLWTTLATSMGSLFGAVNSAFPVPRVILDPLAAAGTLIIAPSNAAISFKSPGAPVRLQALDIPRGGVDLGVWGYFAYDVLYPAAVTKVTGYVPAVVPTILEGDDSGRKAK